ncbi:larval cuticle protein A1A-like [Penaeus japonicus]|uniref:larval cuticle protein A1A-like n=1 Tax=Penaeus japonicus TaxID=27405 RepID=UPI001C70C150|nr:larval cuticle protein A1A-like [Penaeus japonicus]
MKIIVLTALVASCCAAPHMYRTVSAPSALVYAQSHSPAVMKIPEPGINLGTPFVARAPVVPVVKAAAPVTIVQSAAPVAVAPVAPVLKSTAFVAPAAPVAVAPAAVAPVTPVFKSAPAVTVVAPPEPLMAPEPPMPSLSVPHVGGQFHAQDEAGQYTFGHYGGPNTRVETRDSLGRTSGSFAYVDPEGDVQVRKYAAAPVSGFKVAASDLVEDTPAVAQVKSALARAHQAANSLVTAA